MFYVLKIFRLCDRESQFLTGVAELPYSVTVSGAKRFTLSEAVDELQRQTRKAVIQNPKNDTFFRLFRLVERMTLNVEAVE